MRLELHTSYSAQVERCYLRLMSGSLPHSGHEQQSTLQCAQHGERHIWPAQNRLQDLELAGEAEEVPCGAQDDGGSEASEGGEEAE